MHTYYVYVNVKIMTVLLNNEHVLIMTTINVNNVLNFKQLLDDDSFTWPFIVV
jgi:hypothetical protein